MNNLISIIIPVYNQAQEIEKCLDSVLNQTCKNYEMIIINDGSTDGTALILDKIKHKFWNKKIRFKIVSQSNSGSNAARNRGLKEVKPNLFKQGGEGEEYLIFWDADVVARLDMLEKMLKALLDNPQASYAYCSFIFGKKNFKLWEFDENKLKEMPYIHTTSLCRKSHFPGWDEKVERLQDWDVWLTMLERGRRGVWVDEVLFTVINEHGTMSKWLPKAAYKFMPWNNDVKRYKEAVDAIRRKHQITDFKSQKILNNK